MTDLRKEMMEKFDKMKARQQAAKENRIRRLNQETTSMRQQKKKDGNGESLSKREAKRRKKNKLDKKEEDISSKKERKHLLNHLMDDVFVSFRERKKRRGDGKEKKRKNKSCPEMDGKTSRDIPATDAQKENFCKFLSEIFALGVQGLLQQYQTYLKTYVPPDVTRVAFDKNMERNRYKDVVCIDQTRVVLKNAEQDYIHASHVRGEPFVNPFICTQGPMKNTVNDFWTMIIQEKVSHIFMLCNVTECGKSRCAQYWPPDEGSTAEYAGIVVKNTSVEDGDSTFITTKLEAEGRGEHLSIKHLRWKNWPDKGVPSSVFAPFRMLKLARQSTVRPTVVHCSAGIGRTGCIVATELCVQLLLTLKPFNIVRAVQQLRSMRMSAVQTDTQFVYVVRCLLAYASTCGVMQNKPELLQRAAKFEAEYNSYFNKEGDGVIAVAANSKEIAEPPDAPPPFPPKVDPEPPMKPAVIKQLVPLPFTTQPVVTTNWNQAAPTTNAAVMRAVSPAASPVTLKTRIPATATMPFVTQSPALLASPSTSNMVPKRVQTRSPNRAMTTITIPAKVQAQERPEMTTLTVPKGCVAKSPLSLNDAQFQQQQQQRQQCQVSLYVTRF